MRPDSGRSEKRLKLIIHITLLLVVAWGLASVLMEIRPFWIDEWRIIYNLKFKSSTEIWGKLALMQQFPRLYLFLLRAFSSFFDYSYQSLRILPYLFGLLTIYSIYQVASRLYGSNNKYRFLMVMMLISSGTFTKYFVDVKQYTAELLLSAAAVWQLYYLLGLANKPRLNVMQYVLFSVGMLVAPFFSYTYPIVMAPVYVVVLISNINNWSASDNTKGKIKTILIQWIPLFLCTFGITAFYIIDASHLSTDSDMQECWAHLMPGNGAGIAVFMAHVFHFFAQAGSGLVFWWLFGLLCSGAFAAALYRLAGAFRKKEYPTETYILAYAVLLVCLVFALNIARKLPLGEPRLNAFAICALAILLTHMLQHMKERIRGVAVPAILFYTLMAGLTGNIYTTITASFTDDKYKHRMDIYRNTEAALAVAEEKQLPILITPDIAWPYNNTRNFPFDNDVPGDWVLMAWPGYKIKNALPVYAIPDTNNLKEYLQRLPEGVSMVMTGDGLRYEIAETHKP